MRRIKHQASPLGLQVHPSCAAPTAWGQGCVPSMLQADKSSRMSRSCSSKDAPISKTSPTQLLNGAVSLSGSSTPEHAGPSPSCTETNSALNSLPLQNGSGSCGSSQQSSDQGKLAGLVPQVVFCGILFPGWSCSSRNETYSKIWSPKTETLSASFLEPHSAPPKHTNNQRNRPDSSLKPTPTDALHLLQLFSSGAPRSPHAALHTVLHAPSPANALETNNAICSQPVALQHEEFFFLFRPMHLLLIAEQSPAQCKLSGGGRM